MLPSPSFPLHRHFVLLADQESQSRSSCRSSPLEQQPQFFFHLPKPPELKKNASTKQAVTLFAKAPRPRIWRFREYSTPRKLLLIRTSSKMRQLGGSSSSSSSKSARSGRCKGRVFPEEVFRTMRLRGFATSNYKYHCTA